MDKYAKAFVKSSLIYLGIGTILGCMMVVGPDIRFTLTRVHVHILLLGFMAMMIYGVGYHILPRFMGRPVYSHRLGNVQVWLANITLIGSLHFLDFGGFCRAGSGTTWQSCLALAKGFPFFSLSSICGRV